MYYPVRVRLAQLFVYPVISALWRVITRKVIRQCAAAQHRLFYASFFLCAAQLVALLYPQYADVTKRRLYRLQLDRIVTPAEVYDLPSLFIDYLYRVCFTLKLIIKPQRVDRPFDL